MQRVVTVDPESEILAEAVAGAVVVDESGVDAPGFARRLLGHLVTHVDAVVIAQAVIVPVMVADVERAISPGLHRPEQGGKENDAREDD